MSNNIKALLMATTAAIALSACQSGDKATTDNGTMIDKPEYKPTDRQYCTEALEAFGRVGTPIVSPDKSKILYSVSYESVEENRSNADLYLMNVDGSDAKRLTQTPESENGATWIDGGNKIAFMAKNNDTNQLWVMNADGSGRKCVSDVENGISGFLFSPDGKHVLMIGTVKYARTAQDVYPDLPKATGRVIDDLMYKHWDEWVTEIPHPFLGDFDGSSVTNVTDIMADEPFESPMKPFGGVESFAWAP
ncbi:MAG: peptidase S9, partial [Muribaculaceae bacterium]|nr:peptidase S9 [Muribaculaceae bacterium]